MTYMEKPLDGYSNAVIFPTAGTVVGKFAGHKAAIFQTNIGSADSYIDEVIRKFPNAKFVIGVGVGCAFDRKMHKIGDVLVSSKIDDVQVLDKLFDIFCKDLTFDESYPVSKPDNPSGEARCSKVHAGTLVSYSVLMHGREFHDKFKSADVIGGEMDSGNILKFQLNERVPFGVIMIKGVVGHGDSSWQFTAAMAAFAYARIKLILYYQGKVTIYCNTAHL